MTTYDVLVSVRDALAKVAGVKTCKIGMEPEITPEDYPLVRIVPSILRDGVPRGVARECEALLYFGLNVHDFEGGLEAVYAKMLEFEQQLLAAARSATAVGSVVLIETILDEDKIEAFKTMALKVKIVG